MKDREEIKKRDEINEWRKNDFNDFFSFSFSLSLSLSFTFSLHFYIPCVTLCALKPFKKKRRVGAYFEKRGRRCVCAYYRNERASREREWWGCAFSAKFIRGRGLSLRFSLKQRNMQFRFLRRPRCRRDIFSVAGAALHIHYIHLLLLLRLLTRQSYYTSIS